MEFKESSTSNTFETKGALIFLLGAVVGATASYFFTKKKYSNLVDKAYDEINEKRKEISERIETYHAVLQKEKEEREKDISEDLETDSYENFSGPYPISLDSFVEDRDFDKETLILYNGDNVWGDEVVLTDQYDHQLDIQDIFEEDFDGLIKYFGRYEEDILYIRNEKLSTDYEIVWEHKMAPDTVIPEGDEHD